jgi:hypothetical protein
MAKTATTWVVTTSGDRPLDDIAADLRKRGFKVKKILRDVNSITGTGAADLATKARQVSGVTDVSPDVPIDIGPPNSSDTW